MTVARLLSHIPEDIKKAASDGAVTALMSSAITVSSVLITKIATSSLGYLLTSEDDQNCDPGFMPSWRTFVFQTVASTTLVCSAVNVAKAWDRRKLIQQQQ